jgi:hypothetical protein
MVDMVVDYPTNTDQEFARRDLLLTYQWENEPRAAHHHKVLLLIGKATYKAVATWSARCIHC